MFIMPTVNAEKRKSQRPTLKNLPRDQKIAVVFLSVFALLIIGLWVFQVSTQIYKPFNPSGLASKINTASTTSQSLKDSDGDGLLDYEEVNTYHTSPYLEDSDSDGIPDNQEIMQGTDPNCPTGKNCNAAETTANASSNPPASSTVDALDFGALGADILSTSTEGTSTAGNITEVTAAMIRQELLKSGVKQADIDKISDQEIMKVYEDSLNNSGTVQ